MNRLLSLLLLLGLLGLGYGLAWYLSRHTEPLRSPQTIPLVASADDCDLGQRACTAGDVRMLLAGPARPLVAIPFVIETRRGLSSVEVVLEMQGMDMGPNRHRARQTRAGHWEGQMMFPVCVSGRSDWRVHVLARDSRGKALRWTFRLVAEAGDAKP